MIREGERGGGGRGGAPELAYGVGDRQAFPGLPFYILLPKGGTALS